MKKTYEKPEVYFESFELSKSIATGCGAGYDHINTDFGTPSSCHYFYGTDKVFLNLTACNLTDPGEEMFCYHVPTSDSKVFSS